MNCREVGSRLQALADDQIGPAHRRAVEEHLEGCARCAEAAREARQNVSFLVERLAHLRKAIQTDLSGLQAPAISPPRNNTEVTEPRSKVPLVIIAVAVLITLAAAAFFLLNDDNGVEEPTDQGRITPTETGERPKRDQRPEQPTRTTREPPRAVDPSDSTTVAPGPGIPGKTGQPAPLGIAAMLPVLRNRPTQGNLERAWEALARNPGYTPRLLARIENAEDTMTRAVLVLVLGADHRSEDARATLFRLLAEDGAPEVRTAAGAAMAWSAEATGQKIPTIRGLMVPVGPIEDRASLKKLLVAAEAERDPTVVATLIRAVGPSEGPGGEISSRLVELARSESVVVRDAALAALSASPPADSRIILRLIEDTSLPVASRAALVHGLAGSRDAVAHLSRIIRRAEEVPLQVAAVDALKECWDRYARIELLETLRSSTAPEVRRAAVGVLSFDPSKASLEALQRAARDDDDPGTRQEARQAAIEMKRALEPDSDTPTRGNRSGD